MNESIENNYRTDLVLEEVKSKKKGTLEEDIQFFSHTKRSKVTLLNEQFGKKKGTYFTIETHALDTHDHDTLEELRGVITDTLKEIYEINGLSLEEKCLVVGLGNRYVTPDSLGPRTLDDVLVTRHLFLNNLITNDKLRNVSLISPSVMGKTGMESMDIIQGVVNETKPDFLVVIDALAARSLNRLSKSIQITDAGINPGSGIGNNRKEINKDTLGIPVIAIGVPLVIDLASLTSEIMDITLRKLNSELENNDPLLTKKDSSLPEASQSVKKEFMGNVGLLSLNDKQKLISETLKDNFFVCNKDIDQYIEDLNHIISDAINFSLHDSYNRQETMF